MADRSHLTPKVVTTSAGHQQTVYVNGVPKPPSPLDAMRRAGKLTKPAPPPPPAPAARRPRHSNEPERLYHTEVGLPRDYEHPTHTVRLAVSNHAKMEAQLDRYSKFGAIKLPETVDLSKMETVEVGMRGDDVSKVVFRGKLDYNPRVGRRDLVLVLCPPDGDLSEENEPWFCKTMWVNLASDRHDTLDTSKYVTD